MKKVITLTESDLSRIVKKVIKEQELKRNPEAVKNVNELINNIKTGFCIPTYQEGPRTNVRCKDKKYYIIQHYRPFGG
jgi:hypothetical protein